MSNYPFFSVMGIEIEYMLVEKNTLNIAPMSDVLLTALAGCLKNEACLGDIIVSNELVLHVIECKNNGPKPPNTQIAQQFHAATVRLKPYLDRINLQLLPTGAHPWMDPHQETQRWMHDNTEIYAQYDKIFNCRGHGWSNLQSMHVNLPFNNDEEFNLLHNSIRLLLPLLPAIAASTPILDGKPTGLLSSRLHYYGQNQQKIPEISGAVIPEFIQTQAEYEQKILQPMYEAIKPYDPDGLLQYEWLNSRGVIPKFAYNALEIRIIDSQECPDSDLAIALAVQSILKNWCIASDYFLQKPCSVNVLKSIYDETLYYGLDTKIENAELFRQWQLPKKGATVRHIWALLLERFATDLDEKSQRILEQMLNHGNLSERILKVYKKNPSLETLKTVYQQLGSCLLDNQTFGLL